MKKMLFVAVTVMITFTLIAGCSGDQRNAFKRKGVEFFDGDYKVTHYTDSGKELVYTLKDEKISSSPKGYYFFWHNGNYTQVPIMDTVIEEIK